MVWFRGFRWAFAGAAAIAVGVFIGYLAFSRGGDVAQTAATLESTPVGGELVVGQTVKAPPPEEDLARGGAHESAEEQQEGRLPGPRTADLSGGFVSDLLD